jgi:hypothetical protein
MPEPIKVKNRHLVNITRPAGIDTVGSSLKVPNYDLRAAPVCPQFVVGPWNQSSVSSDINRKSL